MRLRLILISCIFLMLAACRPARTLVETSLYFGMSKADGGQVPDSAWQQFLRKEVAAVFSGGFTIVHARGMWRQSNRIISERSAVVVSVNAMSAPLSLRIDSLRERYKAAFDQQSVMRVDVAVRRWDY